MAIGASLIISVYSKVRFLNLVLAGVTRQTYKKFEIIIADDGSGEEMRQYINQSRQALPYEIKHIWHEDNGFRKNKILNKAIKASASDYLIFIDGDCIPHKNFIESHIEEKEPNSVLCGSRVMLSNSFSDALSLNDVQNGKVEKFSLQLVIDALRGKASRLEDGIRNRLLLKIQQRKQARILGSNFSIEKSMLEEINGFDERYEGPGLGEDSDVEFRLNLLGVKFKSVRNYAIIYHLYHQKTMELTDNWKIYNDTKQRNSPVCLNGLENKC
ncbi:MAG: glycosyltransferase [Bacteroidota bacterium]|nr:glycosyltransferase [Bacteroidota bacterium]